MAFASIAPLMYFYFRPHSFGSCGPHAGYEAGSLFIAQMYIASLDGLSKDALQWFFSPLVQVVLIFLLSIIIYFLRADVAAVHDRLESTVKEVVTEMHSTARMNQQLREATERLRRREERRERKMKRHGLASADAAMGGVTSGALTTELKVAAGVGGAVATRSVRRASVDTESDGSGVGASRTPQADGGGRHSKHDDTISDLTEDDTDSVDGGAGAGCAGTGGRAAAKAFQSAPVRMDPALPRPPSPRAAGVQAGAGVGAKPPTPPPVPVPSGRPSSAGSAAGAGGVSALKLAGLRSITPPASRVTPAADGRPASAGSAGMGATTSSAPAATGASGSGAASAAPSSAILPLLPAPAPPRPQVNVSAVEVLPPGMMRSPSVTPMYRTESVGATLPAGPLGASPLVTPPTAAAVPIPPASLSSARTQPVSQAPPAPYENPLPQVAHRTLSSGGVPVAGTGVGAAGVVYGARPFGAAGGAPAMVRPSGAQFEPQQYQQLQGQYRQLEMQSVSPKPLPPTPHSAGSIPAAGTRPLPPRPVSDMTGASYYSVTPAAAAAPAPAPASYGGVRPVMYTYAPVATQPAPAPAPAPPRPGQAQVRPAPYQPPSSQQGTGGWW